MSYCILHYLISSFSLLAQLSVTVRTVTLSKHNTQHHDEDFDSGHLDHCSPELLLHADTVQAALLRDDTSRARTLEAADFGLFQPLEQ